MRHNEYIYVLWHTVFLSPSQAGPFHHQPQLLSFLNKTNFINKEECKIFLNNYPVILSFDDFKTDKFPRPRLQTASYYFKNTIYYFRTIFKYNCDMFIVSYSPSLISSVPQTTASTLDDILFMCSKSKSPKPF